MKDFSVSIYRVKTRNPDYCSKVSSEELDFVINYLLESKCRREEIHELLACLSNVLLLNRDIHTNYFTEKYSQSVLSYVVGFTISLEKSPLNQYFKEVLSIYRTIFLILSDKNSQLAHKTIHSIKSCLFDELKTFFDGYSRFKDEQTYQLAFSELLKALYACTQYPSSDSGGKKGYGFLTYIVSDMLNTSELSAEKMLLLKNILNLFVVIDPSQVLEADEFWVEKKTTIVYILSSVKQKLTALDNDSKDVENLINLLAIMNKIVKFIGEHPTALMQSLVKVLIDPLDNLSDKTSVYSVFSRVVVETQISSLKDDSLNYKNAMYLNQLLLDILFGVTKIKYKSENMLHFLNITGYLNSKSYIESNDLQIPAGLDLNDYLLPQFVDRSLLEKYLPVGDITSTSTSVTMSEEEKEREAERLFTLFERMEKNEVFQGFENPIRTWQQTGRFEDISDDENSD